MSRIEPPNGTANRPRIGGCIEQVRRPNPLTGRSYGEPCRNGAKYRVDGLGPLGALYSDVPMCSTHRAKYDRAGYRSWPIVAPQERRDKEGTDTPDAPRTARDGSVQSAEGTS